MTQSGVGNYCLELVRYVMDSPTIGLALVVTTVVVSYLSLAKQRHQLQKGKPSLPERISEYSSP